MDSPACDHGDFGFAFNDSNFSDRLLRIYIFSDPIESTESPSEEDALMELLKFMYNKSLTLTTTSAILDVLMVADKFEVASCIRQCGRLLKDLQITPEFVVVYLDLPSTILMSVSFQTLTIAVKQFYAIHYKDITKFQDELLSLPLASVEAIIASDDLKVKSEDEVYNFVLKWATTQYPKIKDRHEIIRTRLAKFIR